MYQVLKNWDPTITFRERWSCFLAKKSISPWFHGYRRAPVLSVRDVGGQNLLSMLTSQVSRSVNGNMAGAALANRTNSCHKTKMLDRWDFANR